MKTFQGKIFVRNGKIDSLKTGKGYLKIIFPDENREYDFGNSYAIPGLVDSHGHVAALGKQINGLTLNDCRSAEECAFRASRHNISRGSWITGKGWNQELWEISDYPHRKILDDIIPGQPVYLMRVDGHTCWVNSKALESAGITKNTPDPPGGTIEKDARGNLTGILTDNAIKLVHRFIPAYSSDQIRAFILDAMDALASVGITEVHDMDVPDRQLKIYNSLSENNQLTIKIQSYISTQDEEFIKKIRSYRIGSLHVAGIKFYADGALGSHGAALIEPYTDRPAFYGLRLTDNETLIAKAREGLDRGFYVATHAIGDAANRLVLNAYRSLRDEGYTKNTDILRIEHAQIVHPDDLKMFGELGIYAAVQPMQCITDTYMAPKRLGERIRYCYPWRSLIKNGARLMGGSDFPIESQDPFWGIDAFIRRTHPGEKHPYNEKEILSLDEAFDAYISVPRELTSRQFQNGRLEEKMDADICVLKEDPKLATSDIKNIRPEAVFCDGELTYPKK